MDIKVVVLIVVATSVCDSRSIKDEFTEHSRRVSILNYPCKDPRPKVFYFEELAEEKTLRRLQNVIEDVRPFATVLHRCEGTGCCDVYNKKCKPQEVEPTVLTFFVGTRFEYVHIKAINHTLCGCEDTDELNIK